jgi:hypothetical protein
MQAPLQFSTPSQGFLGGIGLAISATLLLYSTGRTLGVSGMIHRSIRSSSPLSSSARQGDIVAILGFLLGGICVGALEEKYAGPGARHRVTRGGTDSSAGTSVFSHLATVAVAGLLCGIGTKVERRLKWKALILIVHPVGLGLHIWPYDLRYLSVLSQVGTGDIYDIEFF